MEQHSKSKLHQIGPYFGRVKPNLARKLILDHSCEDGILWDPFCGSGTIPLEGKILSRNVIASDINPYGIALTRAKLHARPSSLRNFQKSIENGLDLTAWQPNISPPNWVKSFFHPRTLFETAALFEFLKKRRNYFLIGCLLGILHHQRPGFLSYPSSNFAPYLRNKKYPRKNYPELYEYRDPIPRLLKKAKRILAFSEIQSNSTFKIHIKSALTNFLSQNSIDCIITSPPYMDTLDYARDNRLRLWFLGVKDYKTIRNQEIRGVRSFSENMTTFLRTAMFSLKKEGRVVLILGDVNKGEVHYDIPNLLQSIVKVSIPELYLISEIVEQMPANQKAFRGKVTKTETILAFQKY